MRSVKVQTKNAMKPNAMQASTVSSIVVEIRNNVEQRDKIKVIKASDMLVAPRISEYFEILKFKNLEI